MISLFQLSLKPKYVLPWADPLLSAAQIMALPVIKSRGRAILDIKRHPAASKIGRMPRTHALLWAHGQPVGPEQVAHHLDENKLNDEPANLIVCGRGTHTRLHATGRAPSVEARTKIAARLTGNKGRPYPWSADHRERFVAARAATGNKYTCRRCGQSGHNVRTCDDRHF